MARYLGYQATQWNALVGHDASRRHVERMINRRLHREWIAKLTANQFRVYSFIVSRTLGWQKYAEAIPMSVFMNGIVEADGTLYLDEKKWPICAGTGIRKEDTVRDAIRSLENLKLITVFAGKRGTVTPANVYMPMNESDLARLALQEGLGILPEYLPTYFKGEHVIYEGGFYQVGVVELDAVNLWAINKYRERVSASSMTVAKSEIERIRLEDWENFIR